MKKMNWIYALAACLIVHLSFDAPLSANEQTAIVGMPHVINDVVVAGSLLEAVPTDNDVSPVVVRIVNAIPEKDSFRYTIEYHGLEPGSFDLKDYLQRADRSSSEEIPSLPISVKSTLPADSISVASEDHRQLSWFHHYQMGMVLGGILWVVGLYKILTLGRKPTVEAIEEVYSASPLDVLSQIAHSGQAAELSHAERAEIERLIFFIWRQIRHVDEPASTAIVRLKGDSEAGPMIAKLERWLHSRQGGDVDLPSLLSELRRQEGLISDEYTARHANKKDVVTAC